MRSFTTTATVLFLTGALAATPPPRGSPAATPNLELRHASIVTATGTLTPTTTSSLTTASTPPPTTPSADEAPPPVSTIWLPVTASDGATLAWSPTLYTAAPSEAAAVADLLPQTGGAYGVRTRTQTLAVAEETAGAAAAAAAAEGRGGVGLWAGGVVVVVGLGVW
ncbi:hypothetical protein NpPPO83_00009992 [Neofusicoccum parvum]|uniref:Uncharacterized protein n=1 Tax=Neofusicoccum parvum TaxID=310453 RepID=A0ACB5S1V7_9PEZI|nr:hypothetical protein NpPPO83_00009992 [Neofusicoccum parvum]